MPRTMYYAGVFFCGLLALAAGLQSFAALGYLWPEIPPGGNVGLALTILLGTVPVAALFLRMASLLAARNLFSALFAAFAVAASAAAGGVFAVLQIHNALVSRRIPLIETPLELVPVSIALDVVTGYAAAFFFAIALLALRPYFQVQSSRFLSVLVGMPFLLFVWFLGEQMVLAGSLAIPRASAAHFAGMMLASASFISIAIHSLRHRPLFVEVTNLRELLATPFDRRDADAPLPLNGGVAFDS